MARRTTSWNQWLNHSRIPPIKLTSRKLTAGYLKWWVGTGISFSIEWFSGSILIYWWFWPLKGFQRCFKTYVVLVPGFDFNPSGWLQIITWKMGGNHQTSINKNSCLGYQTRIFFQCSFQAIKTPKPSSVVCGTGSVSYLPRLGKEHSGTTTPITARHTWILQIKIDYKPPGTHMTLVLAGV